MACGNSEGRNTHSELRQSNIHYFESQSINLMHHFFFFYLDQMMINIATVTQKMVSNYIHQYFKIIRAQCKSKIIFFLYI